MSAEHARSRLGILTAKCDGIRDLPEDVHRPIDSHAGNVRHPAADIQMETENAHENSDRHREDVVLHHCTNPVDQPTG